MERVEARPLPRRLSCQAHSVLSSTHHNFRLSRAALPQLRVRRERGLKGEAEDDGGS